MIFSFRKTRRRYIRVLPEKDFPVIADINGEDFLEIVYVKDISIDGICIMVPHEFRNCRIDKEVSVVVTLPHPVNKSILLSGRIRHVLHDTFGVLFSQISKNDQKRLRDYVTYRLKDRSWLIKFLFNLRLL